MTIADMINRVTMPQQDTPDTCVIAFCPHGVCRHSEFQTCCQHLDGVAASRPVDRRQDRRQCNCPA